MKEYPEDFDTDIIERARRERRLFWESMGVKGTAGEIKGFNAKSWDFNMKNRFNWADKRIQEIKEMSLRGNLSKEQQKEIEETLKETGFE